MLGKGLNLRLRALSQASPTLYSYGQAKRITSRLNAKKENYQKIKKPCTKNGWSRALKLR
jgi:hypothetical protein